MPNFDRLLKDIVEDAPLEHERVDRLKDKVRQEQELSHKKAIVSGTFACLIGLAIMAMGGIIMRDAVDMRFLLIGTATLIVGYETTVLAKLAYGNLITYHKILATTREVQLNVLENLHGMNKSGDKEVQS